MRVINKAREKIRLFIKSNKNITEFLLERFIKLHNYSYKKISEYAGYLNNDIHPKHTITNYHKFFVDNVDAGDVVLDLGCGNGYLSYDVAQKAKRVIGMDIKDYNINEAKKKYKKENLEFLLGDATEYNFKDKFNKIILSNVLEHIENRVEFLGKLKNVSKIILLRVPMENRDWITMYKKERGIEYRLDQTHFIEYTLDTLKDELIKSGWKLDYYQVNWGEIWGIMSCS